MTTAPDETGPPVDVASSSGRLIRTAGLVTVITTLGSLLGLVRDVLIARYFGASGDTDAFLVAWTIPETATPLLMEGALTFLLVPVMARELELRRTLQRVVDRTLLPALLVLLALSTLVLVLAPAIVGALAPGLAEPELAVQCVRVAAPTVFFLGAAGYLMATLRTLGRFFVPAWVYVAYNVGIVTMIVVLHARLGVLSAAIGLTVGSAAMAAIQIGPVLRSVRFRSLRLRLDRGMLLALGTFVPIALYTVLRQAQVLVERFLGSELDPGAISHLNYATKVAQIPMIMATTVAAVAMPSLARHAAAGRARELAESMGRNLRIGVLVVLPAVAALVVVAPQLTAVLFERGAFGPQDTADTATLMAVYSTGLLGQTLVGIAVVCFWTLGRRTWYPAVAMLTGLAVTIAVGVATVDLLGAPALALANALGISVTAVLLLTGVRSRVPGIDWAGLVGLFLRLVPAAGAAGAAGWLLVAVSPVELDLVQGLLGGSAVAVVYVAVAAASGVPELRQLLGRLRPGH